MSRSPFVPNFTGLPNSIPIFPLPGTVLMPHAELPLNIFEPRYLNMVDDVLGSHRMIGMIQPDARAGGDEAICQVGCAGRVTQFRETRDGCYEMVLSGVCRFEVNEELPTTRGYRLVGPEWSRFACDYDDPEPHLQAEQQRLMSTLEHYFEEREMKADLATLQQMPVVNLIDALVIALPFSLQEKQMLLESVEPEQRMENFLALIQQGTEIPKSVTRH